MDIATPTISHPPLVDAAIAAGKHVLCQKPLTYDVAKAEDMVRAAANAGVRLAVNQNGRWDQAFRSVYALKQRGDLRRPDLLCRSIGLGPCAGSCGRGCGIARVC